MCRINLAPADRFERHVLTAPSAKLRQRETDLAVDGVRGEGFPPDWAVLDLLCKLTYGLGAHGAARYLRSGSGQSAFNRVSAALFSCAGAVSLLNARV
jgi:hypothetical protein